MEFIKYGKKFKDHTVFSDFDLVLEDGAVTVILGNSGIGKTTLLNALAGLDADYTGKVDTDACAYIFQEPRLLKGATVLKNVELACHNRSTAEKYLKAVEMDGYADKYPKELSGGMAQRVSMARAFAAERPILLMDEPFSSLDMGLKHRLYQTFRTLWQTTRPSVVFITHDPDEATELADRIIVLKGSPAQIVFDVDMTKADKEKTVRDLKQLLIG